MNLQKLSEQKLYAMYDSYALLLEKAEAAGEEVKINRIKAQLKALMNEIDLRKQVE